MRLLPSPAARRCAFREEQRQPAAHRRADHHLAARGRGEHRPGLLEPAGNRPVLEAAAGTPVPGIVEAGHGEAASGGEGIERYGLGAAHVRAETAEPEEAGFAALSDEHRDLAGRGAGADQDAPRLWRFHRIPGGRKYVPFCLYRRPGGGKSMPSVDFPQALTNSLAAVAGHARHQPETTLETTKETTPFANLSGPPHPPRTGRGSMRKSASMKFS